MPSPPQVDISTHEQKVVSVEHQGNTTHKTSSQFEQSNKKSSSQLKPSNENCKNQGNTAKSPSSQVQLPKEDSMILAPMESSFSEAFTIPAPMEQSFSSREICLESIQAFAREKGFAIATGNGWKLQKAGQVVIYQHPPVVTRDPPTGPQVLAACSEKPAAVTQKPETTKTLPNIGQKPENDPPKPRKNIGKTRKTNCPFRMTLTHNTSTNLWDLVVNNPSHNHSPSDHPSAHIIHRKLTGAQKTEITRWSNAGVMPLKVKNGMMQDKSTPLYANLRAFHNLNYTERQKNRRGEFPMATMVDSLKSKGFEFKVKSTLDETTGINHLNAVFFSLPESLQLARKHASCLLIDATYKTNRYKFPLLHVTAINSCEKTFTVAFCFINTEKEVDFCWALEQLKFALEPHVPSVIVTDKEQALMSAIENVFPSTRNLLCQWHMGKNIWSHCHKLLGDLYLPFREAWNFLIASRTPSMYEKNYKKLVAASDSEPEVMSLHAAIKRFLKGSNSLMHTTICDMHDAVKHQLHELLIECATQKQVHINNLPDVLNRLAGKISHQAIQSVQCLLLADKGKSPECPEDCHYESYMGKPCLHKMRRLELEGKYLVPEDFRFQWHLPEISADTLLPTLSEPDLASNQASDDRFLSEVFERFQQLPAREKPAYIESFTRLLDQTHTLAAIQHPLEQTHKGRPHGPAKQPKPQSERSTKRDPSAWEHQIPKNPVGRPRKPEQPETAKKNPVGRPRKAESKSNEESNEVEPPKKRGRPRKIPPADAGSEKEAEGNESFGKKRKQQPKQKNIFQSSKLSEEDDMNFPDDPLDITTRSGRVIQRETGGPSKKHKPNELAIPISTKDEDDYQPSDTEVETEHLDKNQDLSVQPVNNPDENEELGQSDEDAELSASDSAINDGYEWKQLNQACSFTAIYIPNVGFTKFVSNIWLQAHPQYLSVSKRVRHTIAKMHQVDGDGHCGFRSAAVSMGLDEGKWADIRREMVKEMDAQEIYKEEKYIFDISDSIPFARLRSNLNYFRSPTRTTAYWINFPRHGDLLADTYQRPVIHVSNLITNTYLPLSHGPNTNPPIFLVFLEGENHYNAFKCIYPAPVISPGWFKWRSEIAKGWENIIQIHREEWAQRFPQEPPGSPVVIDLAPQIVATTQ
ncbi:hypothetical protein MJO28_001161 [Puccinia striiformis f. sp. tritici]|uniref:Uncharacterized protein n=1 Tax=Puccinia striiformis f. sp. tritici TaxID=168172 RepID=A0ACC0EZZ6_9BASI|nr:hypothetical protein MJO28_001161 [Puccinia striiformis f. sp. tritici]